MKNTYLHENDDDSDSDISNRQQLQDAIGQLDNAYGLSTAEENQINSYELASVALTLNEIEQDPEQMAAICSYLAAVIPRNPREVAVILQSSLASLEASSLPGLPSHQLVEVTSDDLTPLISICQSHQTVQAATYNGHPPHPPSTT
ncbi:hypothetical protein K435DRAFT_879308 [Dendrothele bispora CBS 962.96]|uniref:Uncharacterized protein n=1 Tax=Dendrothele bispora (strain CBS 962.96) TaxID=1314807 RepID=A0A4S8KLC6_DENBC|nr:hypothetical protein K435DRAFT_879308 [Dendrothele bispora CBS 962.96]